MKIKQTLAPRRHLWACLTLGLGLAACGGGGGTDGSTSPALPVEPPGSSAAALAPSAGLAQQCAPDNPFAEARLKTASLAREKQWLRSYFDEAYLWPDEVPRLDAEAQRFGGSDVYGALSNYFYALNSTQRTDSGAYRDRFSFLIPTAQWEAGMTAGIEAGYGIEWAMASPTPPRGVRIAYVQAGSVAARAGLKRGDELVAADGMASDTGDAMGVDKLNAALFPDTAGQAHEFTLKRNGADARMLTLKLSSELANKQPVPLQQVLTGSDGRKVGHLLFTEHIAKSEAPLIAAMRGFREAGVQDLVLDLRYNGGGLLFIASELAYMIAGPEPTRGKLFEKLSFNSRRQAESNSERALTPFYDTSCLLDAQGCSEEKPLPTLGLKRVYVLAQSGTCSASEAVINGLRGVDVEVVLIGGRTCGKPYGFTPRDNCGISYFPIEFAGVNAKGFGDYADGFVPAGSGASGVPGCAVADDFSKELGAPDEAMLAAALAHRTSGRCPAVVPGLAKPQSSLAGTSRTEWHFKRSPLHGKRFNWGR